MARRTKFEAEKTRDAILDAAEKVFYKCGVACTSMEQIATTAKVTRGAIYWHFKDKIEVCDAMAARVFLPQEDVLDRLAAGDSNKPMDDLRKACSDSLKLMVTDKRRHRVVTILMFRCEYVEDMAAIITRRRDCKDRMVGRFQRLFERASELKMLSVNWSPRLAAHTLQALMSGLIVNSLEGRKGFKLEKDGPLCLNAFFQALKP